MKREEAIRRIKAWNLNSDDMKVLAVVIPELDENEDEKAHKRIEQLIRLNTSGAEKTHLLAYLEKQKEYKPEWGVEDKLMIKCCLRALEHYKYTGKLNQFVPARFDIGGYLAPVETVENWLKSLCPQSHWKPSDEQMKALYSAVNDAISLYSNKVSPLYEEISRTHFDALDSLYNDLKKLM